MTPHNASFINIVMSRGRDIAVGRTRSMLGVDDFARILRLDPEDLFSAWFLQGHSTVQRLHTPEQTLVFYEIERTLPLVSARIVQGREHSGSRWATARAMCTLSGASSPTLVYREENAQDLSAPPDADFGWWYVNAKYERLEDGGIPLVSKAAAMKLNGI